MVRQRKPAHDLEHADAWSEAWGDRALQDLGRYLVAHGIAEQQAALVVEQIWLFYSYGALPALRERLPMGVAVRTGANRPEIHLLLMTPQRVSASAEEATRSEPFQALRETFARDFAAPLAEQITMGLDFVGGYLTTTSPTNASSSRLDRRLRAHAARQGLEYVGTFLDDLEAELGTIMDPESVPLWLETPNTLFGGRKPRELLHDPLDRRLRDLITRAKFNLSAA